MSKAPPVRLTDKVRELLRLLGSDPVMTRGLWSVFEEGDHPADAMLRLSTLDDETWQDLEDEFREHTTEEIG